MHRSISRWTIAIAAAGLIGLPAAVLAQTTGTSQPPSQSPQASASTSAQTRPVDHVQQAKAALASIDKSSIPTADRSKFAQLNTDLNKLEKDVGNSSASASAKGKTASTKTAAWATETAAIDKLITEIAGPENAASAAAPTGTTGSAPTAASSKTQLDDQALGQLNEVRRQVTAVASEMSGTAPAASPEAQQPTAAAAASSAAPTATPPSSAAPAAPPAQTPATTPQNPATGAQTTTPPAATGTQSSVTQPPAGSATPPAQAQPGAPASAAPAGQADQTAAKQHLTDARDTLSAITQMPEAAHLQGQTRTQVSQLISDFNLLITAQVGWHDSYNKVQADVTSLLGADANAPAVAEPTPSSAAGTGTAGATGTTGAGSATATGTTGTAGALDPAIRAKLVQFRSQLSDFEKAAGGSTPAASNESSSTVNPSVATGATTNPANPATSPAASSAASTTGTSLSPAPQSMSG
ncbi:MAG TPA: hypothetical protein VGL62_01075, partial [Vicinamibacterales bacterium]